MGILVDTRNYIFRKDIDLKNTQVEIIKVKNTKTEMMYIVDRYNSRVDTTVGRKVELKTGQKIIPKTKHKETKGQNTNILSILL